MTPSYDFLDIYRILLESLQPIATLKKQETRGFVE